jgi:poly(ADP-ribose) glycohydrolase
MPAAVCILPSPDVSFAQRGILEHGLRSLGFSLAGAGGVAAAAAAATAAAPLVVVVRDSSTAESARVAVGDAALAAILSARGAVLIVRQSWAHAALAKRAGGACADAAGALALAPAFEIAVSAAATAPDAAGALAPPPPPPAPLPPAAAAAGLPPAAALAARAAAAASCSTAQQFAALLGARDADALQRALSEPAVRGALPRGFFGVAGALPRLAARAAALGAHFPRGLPRLDGAGAAIIPREAVAALLCAALIGALPAGAPSLALLIGGGGGGGGAGKLACFLCYFAALAAREDGPPGDLVLRRVSEARSAGAVLAGAAGAAPVRPAAVDDARSMFDAFPGAQAVDFANCRVGGGALGWGAAQEEALFACAPEHVAAMAVCGELRAHEALAITGARRFSHAGGARAALRCAGAADGGAGDAPAMATLAVDAARFDKAGDRGDAGAQLRRDRVDRDVLKFFAGAAARGGELPPGRLLVTGHWGGGAFGGHRHVKALVQLVAAAAADRDLAYCAFGDAALAADLRAANALLGAAAPPLTAAALYAALLRARATGDGRTLVADTVRDALEE